jgi:membrane-associated phospholipid phosphatase
MLDYIGEYGPLIFISAILLFSLKPIYVGFVIILLLEWTLLGVMWKWILLPWGKNRPKYQSQIVSMKTTGTPSAHTSTITMAIIFSFIFATKTKNWTLFVIAILIAPVIIFQRVNWKHHSIEQVLLGIVTGFIDSITWIFLITFFTHLIPKDI